MAIGLPVLTSKTSSLGEIAGDAAYLIDPEDEEAIAAGLWAILTDARLRENLSRKGKLRAAQFTVEKMVKETLQVYREAIDAYR